MGNQRQSSMLYFLVLGWRVRYASKTIENITTNGLLPKKNCVLLLVEMLCIIRCEDVRYE